MKISDLLKDSKLSISYEVFPPKTESGFESVQTATEKIAKLRPAFMSVTYGAGGGTDRYTLDIAKKIKDNYGVPSLAHLTCVGATKESVAEKIEIIEAAGIKNIMALRGDIPEGMKNSKEQRLEFLHAVDLIRELKKTLPINRKRPLKKP